MYSIQSTSQLLVNKEKSIFFGAIQASIVYLSQVIPDKKKYLESFESRISQNSYQNDNEMIDDFIAFLDIFFIDQIADQREYGQSEKDKRLHLSLYARERNFENLCSASGSDYYACELIVRMKYVLPQLDSDDKSTIYIDTPDPIFDGRLGDQVDGIIHISRPLSYQEYYTFLDKLGNSKLPINGSFLIHGSVDLGNNIITQFSIYEKNRIDEISTKYRYLFDFSHPEDAITHPDIQSVFRSYLSHGCDITGKQVDTTSTLRLRDSTSGEVCDLISDIPHKKRLQKVWPLRIGANTTDTTLFLDKHKEHYSRFFQDPILGKPQVSITTSGAGANNVVSKVLKNYVPNKEDWTGLNFYYENDKVFGSTQVSENTRVLGFCPSLLLPGWEDNDENFTKLYRTQVDIFIHNAQENTREQYFIFVDMTTRIEQNISDIIPIFPENITIITTASLTKYQRGELNYFFGTIMIYNNPELNNRIQEKIDMTIGELNSDQIFAFPRLRKSEILKNSENRCKNLSAFEARFMKALSRHTSIPMPKLIHNDFGIFILPPMPEILHYIKHSNIPDRKEIGIDDTASLIELGHTADGPIGFSPMIVPSFLYPEPVTESGIDLRDSFGFSDSSTSSICMPYSYYFHGKEPTVPVKKIEVPRVSFGYNLNEEKSSFQGECFALSYLEYMYNGIGFPFVPDKK